MNNPRVPVMAADVLSLNGRVAPSAEPADGAEDGALRWACF